MKAACFSVAALDFFPQQNRHFIGGNSLNQAVRYRQMGYESAFIGALGMDEAGDRITAVLCAELVDSSHLYRVEGATARNQIFNDELGERYGIDDAWEGGVYEQFRMDEADWAFASQFEVWSTHANSPCYEDALQRKKDGQLMAVDFLHWQQYDLLERSLAVIDIAYFGGTAVMADTLAKIAKNNNGIIVLTLGAEGSIAFVGDKTFTQPALPLQKVVDTTGCGDAFQAGFTASFYHTRNIQSALLAGAEAGRQAATHFGGVPC